MRIGSRPLLPAFLSGFFLALVSLSPSASSQTTAPNEWTWMGGSDKSNQPGVYGTLGTPAVGNIPGGTVRAMSWFDKNGDFWVFGAGGSIQTSVSSVGFGLPNDFWKFNLTTNEWTWMGGSSSEDPGCMHDCGDRGVYGTLGTPAAGNIPGSRQGATGGVNSDGTLWLFGGWGMDAVGLEGNLNDLWKYDPSTNQWTWLSGSETAGVTQGWPGVYGTLGTSAPTNVPGGRTYASSWTDGDGNFWLFGGQGFDTYKQFGDLNDLWKFDPQTNEWTWMGGSSIITPQCMGVYGDCGVHGVYGTLGTPAAGNIPGGRAGASVSKDRDGNIWLFGGEGFDGAGEGTALDDLWKFDPSKNEWTWMAGPNIVPVVNFVAGQGGVYGTLGVPNASNIPGSRANAVSWIGRDGAFWILGGSGFDANRDSGMLNDLWYYSPSSGEWTWMGGSNLETNCYGDPSESPLTYCGGVNGVYGTLGVPAVGNIPGARFGASSWTDANGNLWLFGGGGYDSTQTVDWPQNDLWEYTPSTTSLPPALTPTFSAPSGTYAGGQLGIFDGMENASIYYTLDGTKPTSASSLYVGPINLTSSMTVQAIALASGYPDSAIASATYIIGPPAAMPTFSVASGIYTSAVTVTINDSTPGASLYYTTDGLTPTINSTVYGAPIIVSSTETLKAIAEGGGYSSSSVATATYTIPPDFTIAASPSSVSVQGGQSGTTTITVQAVGGFSPTYSFSFACSGLPEGALCSFSTLTAPTPTSLSCLLTVNTSAITGALHRNSSPWIPAQALAATLCCIGCRKRRRFQILLLLAVSVFALGSLTGCGGAGSASNGGGSGGSGGSSHQPVTSTVTVTATSGMLSHSTTFTLTVN